MNRTIGYLIPFLVIIIFAVLLNSGSILKKPLGQDDDVVRQLGIIKQAVLAEKWEEATIKTNELERIWQRITFRAQFSVEKDGILGFEKSLYRLKSFIDAKNVAGALAEIGEAEFHFKDLAQ